METIERPCQGEARDAYCKDEAYYQTGPPRRVLGRVCLDCGGKLRSYDPDRTRCEPCGDRRVDRECEVVALWLGARQELDDIGHDPAGLQTRYVFETFLQGALEHLPDVEEIIAVLGVHREARSLRRAAARRTQAAGGRGGQQGGDRDAEGLIEASRSYSST